MRQLIAYQAIIQLLFVYHALGQNPRDRTESLKLIAPKTYDIYKASYPLTRDTLNNYPDSLQITGTVVDYTLGISCGYFCGCGTLKIRLATKIEGYPSDYIYVGIPCFNTLTGDIVDRKEWTLYELSANDDRCYWTEVPMNKFDTMGLPFYVTEKNKIKL